MNVYRTSSVGVRTRGWRLRVLGGAAASLALLAGGSASGATASSWSKTNSGYWTGETNWSTNPRYPNNGTPAGSTYDATISVSGKAYTVTLDANVAINNLTLNYAGATLNHTNGTLTIVNQLTVQSGSYLLGDATISGGRLLTVGNAAMTVTPTFFWTPATLSGVTVAGNVAVQDSARLVSLGDLALDGGTIRLRQGSTLELDGTISGSGQIVFDGVGGVVTPAATGLTVGPLVTIRSGTGGGTVGKTMLATTNKGLISAQTAGQTIGVVGGISNEGTLEAINGGTLVLNPGWAWSNAGTIRVDGGTLNIGGSETLKNLGTFVRNGGTVNLTGGYGIAVGQTLDLSNTSAGAVRLGTGAYVMNGPVTAAGAAIQVADTDGSGGYSTLDRVVLKRDVVVNDGAGLALIHDATLEGVRISLVSTGKTTRVRGSQLTYLEGNGQITFDGAAGGTNVVDGHLELREGIVVRTGEQGGAIGGVHGLIENKGLVSAQTAGKTIRIDGAFRNDGTVEARNAAAVVFTLSVNAANYDGGTLAGGTWRVYDGSTLDMGSAAIQVNAANVLLSGATSSFEAIKALQENRGAFTVTGGRAFTTAGGLENSGKMTVGLDSVVFVNGTLNNTGEVDVSGRLIVQASGSTREEVLAGVVEQIKSARNGAGGLWTGKGIGSWAAREDARRMTGLGAIMNDKLDGSGAMYNVFAGQSVDANCVLVKYTWNGDANLDGVVNADDYFLIDSGFISQKGGWRDGDFNYDGVVNADDYFLIDSAFIGQSGLLAARRAGAVPEPSLLLPVFALAALRMTRRGRK